MLSDSQVIEIYDKLPSFAKRFTADHHDREDLVQDTIVKVLESRAKYEWEIGPIEGWAYRIMENIWLDKKRKENIREEVPLSEETEGLSYELEDKKEKKLDMGMLNVLQPTQRYLARLIYVEGYSYKEAAAAMGVTINSINARLERIRERLKKYHGEDATSPRKILETEAQPRSQGDENEQEYAREEDRKEGQ